MDTRYRRVSYLDAVVMSVPTQLDLVQEMEWEDHTEFLSLEDAGLEEVDEQPIVGGLFDEGYHANGNIYEYCTWFHDGDEQAFSAI